jgi:hypothetical protein
MDRCVPRKVAGVSRPDKCDQRSGLMPTSGAASPFRRLYTGGIDIEEFQRVEQTVPGECVGGEEEHLDVFRTKLKTVSRCQSFSHDFNRPNRSRWNSR